MSSHIKKCYLIKIYFFLHNFTLNHFFEIVYRLNNDNNKKIYTIKNVIINTLSKFNRYYCKSIIKCLKLYYFYIE